MTGFVILETRKLCNDLCAGPSKGCTALWEVTMGIIMSNNYPSSPQSTLGLPWSRSLPLMAICSAGRSGMINDNPEDALGHPKIGGPKIKINGLGGGGSGWEGQPVLRLGSRFGSRNRRKMLMVLTVWNINGWSHVVNLPHGPIYIMALHMI